MRGRIWSRLKAAGMTAENVVQPLRPTGDDWRFDGVAEIDVGNGSFPSDVWTHRRGFRVFSTIEVMPDEVPSKGPEYHLSMSRIFMGRIVRVSSNEARYILSCFGLDGWEEDNHSRLVRNFWRPVNENLVGLECPCKATETAVVEDGGDFVWRPK